MNSTVRRKRTYSEANDTVSDEGIILDCWGQERAQDATVASFTSEASHPALEVIEEANQQVRFGGSAARSAGVVLAGALSRGGLGAYVKPAAAAGLLAPSAVFNAFTSPRYSGFRPMLDPLFWPVAYPGWQLQQPLRVGDVLIRGSVGRRGPGSAAFVAHPALFARTQAQQIGLRLDSLEPGYYAHVLESGPRPRPIEHAFAVRVTDPSGRVAPGYLILRPRIAEPRSR